MPILSPFQGKLGPEEVLETGLKTGSLRALCCSQGAEGYGTNCPPKEPGPSPTPGNHTHSFSPLLLNSSTSSIL